MDRKSYSFYEFFAGGGMARAGLGKNWTCLFANDIDPKKASTYIANWGDKKFKIGDIASVTLNDLDKEADLAWASFPCQDLSLAGAGAGLRGERSGTFWPFWDLITKLSKLERAPRLIVLENVCGALSSHEGRDFAAIGQALTDGGYLFGAVVIDAVHFVPQSRPRLFFIAIQEDSLIQDKFLLRKPDEPWHPKNLVKAYEKLSAISKANWLWWKLPIPPKREYVFASLLEAEPQGVTWHTEAETKRLIEMMSTINLDKVKMAQKAQCKMVGTIYRRTRIENGKRVQRAEIRFDDIAGCLRTPIGGSSRQTIMIIEGNRIRSRLISPRETARLMGLPEEYKLPKSYNEAYHLTGDGLVVPVVSFLRSYLLEPLLKEQKAMAREVAYAS